MVRGTSKSLLWLTGVLAVLFGTTSIAHAGGSWFDPVKDSYEPGEMATLVGYTGGGSYGWIEDGPFFGEIIETNEEGNPSSDGFRLDVGELTLVDTGAGGYLRLRASISFELPTNIPAGRYYFNYCNEACDERLGDLIGGYLFVGTEPEYPISREWPLDDPEVANLDEAALLSGPGFQVSAGKVNDGEVGIGQGGHPVATFAPSTQPASTTTSSPAQPVVVAVAADAETEQRPVSIVGTPTVSNSLGATNWALWGAVGIVVLGLGLALGLSTRRA